MFDAEALGKQMVEIVRGYVARALTGIAERLAALEQQIKAIPAGPKGELGETGAPGLTGKDGAPGERGEKGDRGDTGAAGAMGETGPRGEKGEPGEVGPRGEAGPQGEKGDCGEKGETGERGEPGEKGVTGDRGLPGERGEKGEPGEVGPRGEKGDAGTPGDRGEKGMDGRDGRDGKDGRDGTPGRDGAEIQPMPAIDPEKTYPQGVWAKHAGGLWLSRAQTDGMAGWDCIVNGISDVSVDPGEELRSFTMTIRCSNGAVIERMVSVPTMIYRGIWKAEEAYHRGDTVTRDGCTWVLNADEQAGYPGEVGKDTGWAMAVKRGRDGKDGLRGEKGERGAEGRAGKDLTQMGPDGKKW
jgi:collagen type III alpha